MGEDLRLERITKDFGAATVLRGVDLTIPAGSFVTLLGPSGCGKTTLLRIIAGLTLPDAGRVMLGSQELTHQPANVRPVNTVFQSYALFPHLSVSENIAFGLNARRVEASEVQRRVEQSLTLLHLEALAQRKPAQLSGGQRQRVALARALVNQPRVLLLDEPMSALDARLRSELQVELRRLQRSLGTTFVLVTHDQQEALTVSDHIFVMNKGVIEQQGTPEGIYERPVSRYVATFLGEANLIDARREGGRLATPLGELEAEIPEGFTEGAACIRPERVELRQERPGSNGIRAVVQEVIYRGESCDLFFSVGGLRARVPVGACPKPGEELWVYLPPAHVRAVTGRA